MPKLYPITPAENVLLKARTLPSLLEGGVSLGENKGLSEAVFTLEKGRLSALKLQPDTEAISPGKEWHCISLPPDQFLAPAFVDCHLHLALDGTTGFRTFKDPPPSRLLLARLRELAGTGILTARDGGDRFGTAFRAQRLCANAASSNPLPLIVATGPAIYRHGYYGSKLGGEGLQSGLAGLEKKIQQRKQEGAKQLKVVLSGLVSLQEYGKVGPLQFSPGELREIVKVASAYDLPVMVHASSDAAVSIAVEAGVHSVEHGYYISAESLQKMAAAGVIWVPTIAPLAALAADCESETKDRQEHKNPTDKGKESVPSLAVKQQIKMLSRARALGVTVAVGTDGGAPGVNFKDGYWMELNLLARAGFTPAELLVLAAVNGAMALGLAQERGRITVGNAPFWLCLDHDFLRGRLERNTLKGIIFAVNT